VALAISGYVIPLSRSNTIWILCLSFGFFSRLSARCNRLTWSALHLTICAPAPNQMVSSESHSECCVDYRFASETNTNYRFKSLWSRYETIVSIDDKSENKFQAEVLNTRVSKDGARDCGARETQPQAMSCCSALYHFQVHLNRKQS